MGEKPMMRSGPCFLMVYTLAAAIIWLTSSQVLRTKPPRPRCFCHSRLEASFSTMLAQASTGLMVGQIRAGAGVVGLLGFPGHDAALDVDLPRTGARAVHAVGAAHDLVVRPAVAVGVFPGAVFTVGFAMALGKGLAGLREVRKAIEEMAHRRAPFLISVLGLTSKASRRACVRRSTR